ncbi:MAG: bifunctional metallophosphatase/5'-nucleotidase [Chloroflexota bacterium]|nr:bifunctional metallophosphatase/5'-nucleotidase [Chloroflexota bacterium]
MSWRMMSLPLLILAALLVISPVSAQEVGDFTLTILHTNDTHSHIEEYDGSTTTCPAESEAAGLCIGGVARRATLLADLRASAPDGNAILIDAGDSFNGTLYFSVYKGEESARFMNLLGYQAMAVGNHEFDNGPAHLADFLDHVEIPVLSANIDTSAEPLLDGRLAPYTVIDVNGEPVGVIGLTTIDVPISSSPGPTLKFNDYLSSLAPVLADLDGQGIDKIVLLSHVGYGDDLRLAAQVDGIDVIVGGHSHTLLSSTDPAAAGPYPTVVASPSGDPVLVVQAEAYGKYLGQLVLTFDGDGDILSWEGAPVLVDASVARDPAIQAIVDEMAVAVNAMRDETIGSTVNLLQGDRSVCRYAECTMGNLVADGMRWATQNSDVQVALINGGGLRTSIPAGDISTGSVLEVLPFSNNIATLKLTGADLLAALENGVSRAESPDNAGTGRFPQVSGMRYSWDATKPVGERIVSAEVQNDDGSYSPLVPAAVYHVATLTFLRQGGDDYAIFADKAIDPYDFGPSLTETIADYISQHSPLDLAPEGRITRVDGAAPAGEPAALPASGAATAPLPFVASVVAILALLAVVELGRRRV